MIGSVITNVLLFKIDENNLARLKDSFCKWNVATKVFMLIAGVSHLSGCSSYAVVDNKPLMPTENTAPYSFKKAVVQQGRGEVTLLLTFSGGGTRAAALAYGVLQELRDTRITVDGSSKKLLDEVDVISSVSGGSFTSAYYGLNGNEIFESFEEKFLRYDVQDTLIKRVLNPMRWFSTTDRTEEAIQLYQERIFQGATFADLEKKQGPLIVINASDLGRGVRMSFLQEYFSLLCSELSSFSIARAVTASSAVPFLFNPVVLENYQTCDKQSKVIKKAEFNALHKLQLLESVQGLKSYFIDKKDESRNYVHLVDGGITDNLGLRAIYEIVELVGPVELLRSTNNKPTRALAIITVDASTLRVPAMNFSPNKPSLEEISNAVNDIQIHKYSVTTKELLQNSIKNWTQQVSTPKNTIKPYYIDTNFASTKNREQLALLNAIPTSLSLLNEQVDQLIASGRELLRSNPEFQRLISDLNGSLSAQDAKTLSANIKQ